MRFVVVLLLMNNRDSWNLYTVKQYFQDLLSQHIFFCQINYIIIYLVEITYYFEFLMSKLISFIVLTHFFQFNQLKILRQPRLLLTF